MSAPEMTSTEQAARAYRDRGWRPFPLDHPALSQCASTHKATGGVCPEPDKRGKHPAGHWPTMTATPPTDKMLAHWFGGAPRNIGIAAKPSGLVILDEDERDALELLADLLGEKLPDTYRVLTSRGWHYYFEAPEGETWGNGAGALADHHIDVRGGHGDGGYVVAAGSTHISGVTYVEMDSGAVVAPLPDWIKRQIRTPAKAKREVGATTSSTPGPGGWTDDPRHGTEVALHAQYQRHLNEVRTQGGEFRHELYLAALDGWRLVDLGLLPEATMLLEQKQAIERVWGAPPDNNDRNIVYNEARKKATESPWVVVGAQDGAGGRLLRPGGGADEFFGDGAPGAEVAPAAPTPEEIERYNYEKDKAAERRRVLIRREVQAELAVLDREPVQVLDFDEFLDAPQVDYLIPRMLWSSGTSRIFGPPGETKSFLALDLALSLASGRPWRGHPLQQTVVHYVMAEGQAVNTTRSLAWLHHHGVERSEVRGRFRAIPHGVLLTPEGIAEYLELVQQDAPGLVVLDTKARMMTGSPNSPEDNAVLVRALDALRDACGGNVCLIDHTGVHDTTRAKGDNTVLGAMDTEVRVTLDRDTNIATAEVTRDKAAEDGAAWTYKLHGVPGVPGLRMGAPTPAVIVPLDEDDITAPTGPFRVSATWWNDELPDEVVQLQGTGKEAARDAFRVLLYVSDMDGMTRARILTGVKEGPRKHSDSSFDAGMALLKKRGVVVQGSSSSLWTLAPRFDRP